MRTVYRSMFCLMAMAVFALASSAASAQSASVSSASSLPVVQLSHWQNSTTQERQAFLMGFVSMVQLEHAWQGENTLPVDQSTVATWMRGLSGVSIPQMDAALKAYIAEHPKAMDKSVIEALGYIYVRPNLTQKERDSAGKRYEMLKAGFAQ